LVARLLGDAMTGGMMHGAARMMGSPYGWALIATFVVIVLAAFGLVFAAR